MALPDDELDLWLGGDAEHDGSHGSCRSEQHGKQGWLRFDWSMICRFCARDCNGASGFCANQL